MKRKLKMLCAPLLLIVLMAILSACGDGGNNQAEQQSGQQSNTSGAVEETPAEEPIKISWLGNGTSGLFPGNDGYIVQQLNEMFNVEIDVIEATSNKEQEMSLIYASGDIPNHFLVSANGIHNVIKQDLARTIPVEMIKEVAPNLWESTLENYPLLEKMSIYEDGELLAIPQGTRELFPMTSVRTDWLENLGLDMPTNLDEFEEVVRQFTENDPDGDGEDNTYGFAMTSSYFDIYTLGAAHGISLPGGTVKDDSWLEQEDGTLVKAQVSENFKEFVTYMANLYEKGYIYPDVTVKDNYALFSDGVVGMQTAGWTSFMPKYRPSDWFAMTFTKNPEATTDYLPALAGASGEEAVFETESSVWRYTAIGRDTTDEQLKKVLEIMDRQLVDMDVANLIWRGEEGEHFTIDENGMAVLTEEYSTKEKQAEVGMKFFIVNNRNEEQMNLSFGSEAMLQREAQASYKTKPQLIPSGTFIDSKVKYAADLEKLEKEFYMNTVTGIWDVDEQWDRYVERWYNAGGDQVTEEVNEIYQNL